jgi:hypothetical protein
MAQRFLSPEFLLPIGGLAFGPGRCSFPYSYGCFSDEKFSDATQAQGFRHWASTEPPFAWPPSAQPLRQGE